MIKLAATDGWNPFLRWRGAVRYGDASKICCFQERIVASGRGILSLKKLFAGVRDEVIIAEWELC